MFVRFLKTFYRELASRDPANYPSWAPSLLPGTTCAANFHPALTLSSQSSRTDPEPRDPIRLEQIFSAVRVKYEIILEITSI